MADDFHARYAAYKAAAAARATLPDRLRNTAPYRGLSVEAADCIDYLQAQIVALRKEMNAEAREAQRDARDAYSAGRR